MKTSIQDARQWFRRHWVLSMVLAVFIVGGFQLYTLYFPSPFKATDPDSPFFNPLKFEARDYWGEQDLMIEAAKKAMPKGTDISIIRTIMKNNASCFHEATEKYAPGFVFFVCTSSLKYPGGINIMYQFDDENKLVDYFGSGSRGIYTQKFPEEIIKEMKK